MKKTIYQIGIWSLMLLTFVACDEEETIQDPVPSFQVVADENNFLSVQFNNFSENYSSSSWDFGDGNSSEEDSPAHTYETAGNYEVTLTVSNDAGTEATRTETVEIVDPNQKLTLLTGTESKTWSLVREGTCMFLTNGLEPSNPDYQVFWPGLQNNGTRPCLYDDTFTFTREGAYIYDDAGSFWGEFGVFTGTDVDEQCFDATAANMINKDGDDVSAWLGGTHDYSYNTSDNTITLSGEGAWIGIPKLATSGESVVPVSEVTANAVVVDGGSSMVDTLYVNFAYDGALWAFTYVSYEDETLKPEIVSVNANFSASPSGLTVSFTNTSSGASSYDWDFGDGSTSTENNPTHTYAEAGEYSVTLTASDGSSTNSVTKTVTVSDVTLTDPAPAPTQAEADVISIYSDAYTSIDGVNTNPDWGQATSTTEESVQGDNVLLLSGLNYQGIDFAGNLQDVSGETMVHLDVWSVESVTFNFFLISEPGTANAAETPFSITTDAAAWTSVDIPLSEFSSVVNLSAIGQFKFDDGGSGAAPTFYVDNIYFY